MQIYREKSNTTSSDSVSGPSDRGFSVTELLTVVSIILIVSVISIPYIFSYTEKYQSEDQTLKVIDLMQEAKQMALTRRRTFRFEIDLTDNSMLIIDENGAGSADDRLIKRVPLLLPAQVRIDTAPTVVGKPTPPTLNDATFAADTIGHIAGAITVNGNNVWAARFNSDGSVVNAGGNPISANLYLWPPTVPGSPDARVLGEVRAITLFGGTGALRYWRYDGTKFVPHQ